MPSTTSTDPGRSGRFGRSDMQEGDADLGSSGVLRRTWAGRRGLAAVLLAAVGLTALVAGQGWPQADVPVWSLLSLATVLLAATSLATYVPAAGAGWRPDLGCGSCAAVSGLAAAGAVWFVATSPVALGAGLLGVAVSGFALVKRWTDPEVCAAPVPRA